MFIESLRHVKKNWKIPLIIGVILILIGLMGSYAYLGSSFNGTSASGTGVKGKVSTLKSEVKAAKKEAAANPEDGALQSQLGQSYYSLAAYQTLLFDEDDAKASYTSAVASFEKAAGLFTADTEETEWVTLYERWFGSQVALDDTDNAFTVFKASIDKVGYNTELLTSYATQMIGAKKEDALITQFTELSATIPEDQTEYTSTMQSYLSSAQYSLLSRLQEAAASGADSSGDTSDSSGTTEGNSGE